ncbi:MAG: WecB/TagA/CpsF family glycosyltransferase [Anaerolineae bacterium]
MVKRDQVVILGVPVDNITEEEALARVEAFIEKGRPHQVVTVNPEFVVAAQSDAKFFQVLKEADLSLPDGVGLLWAARFLGTPLSERLAGVDMVRRIASLAAERGYRLFLLGAARGVAEATAMRLEEENPGLKVAGTYAGSPDPKEEEEIVEMIRAARPDVLLVAYGAPQQDLWIHCHLGRLGVPVVMGVGGAFDFISGKAKRAPDWMQRLGLEWLHRLLHQPWRWRRMLALPKFVWLVLTSSRWVNETLRYKA